MDKKRRRNKGNKSNSNAQAVAKSAAKVSSFDTSGLADHLVSCFNEADSLIQSRFTTLAKHEDFLTATKDQTLREIDSCFDKIIQIATRRKQLLKGEVSDVYANQIEDILEKKESVLLSGLFLETLLRQAKEMSSVPPGEKVGFEDMVHREVDRHCSTALNALPYKNLIEFDKTMELSEPLERKLRMVGKVKTEYNLPAMVDIKDCNAVAGLSSSIQLQVLDVSGEVLPTNLVKSGRIGLQLKDCEAELVNYRIDTVEENTITVLFKPALAEKHFLTIFFCGHVLKEIEILVDENVPTLAFGPHEGLVQPNALCSLKDGRVCIADSGASKLLLFSDEGALIAETTFPDGGFVPFDVTSDQKRSYILCSGSAYDDQDDTLSASPEDADCSFPPEMSEDAVAEDPSESSRNKDKMVLANGSGGSNRKDPANIPPDTEDLKIAETTIGDVRVRYIEKRGYITVTSRNQIILGEVNSNTVLVYDVEGHFLRVIASPNLDCLGSIQCKLDGQVIISDIGNCTLLAGTPELGLCERWGSVEMASKQLLLPLGLALDEVGNLLVADGGGPKVFIYGEYGEYIGCLELAPALKESDGTEPKPSPCSSPSRGVEVSVIPWALTVVGESIWIIDNNSHKVLRYSYNTPT